MNCLNLCRRYAVLETMILYPAIAMCRLTYKVEERPKSGPAEVCSGLYQPHACCDDTNG